MFGAYFVLAHLTPSLGEASRVQSVWGGCGTHSVGTGRIMGGVAVAARVMGVTETDWLVSHSHLMGIKHLEALRLGEHLCLCISL